MLCQKYALQEGLDDMKMNETCHRRRTQNSLTIGGRNENAVFFNVDSTYFLISALGCYYFRRFHKSDGKQTFM